MQNIRSEEKKDENGKQNSSKPYVDRVTWTDHDP